MGVRIRIGEYKGTRRRKRKKEKKRVMIKLGFSSKKFFSKLSEEFQSCFFPRSLELGSQAGVEGRKGAREDEGQG